MTVPSYAVEVGWDNQTPTAIVGTCTVDGALAVVLGEWGGLVWSSIYDDVKSLQIRRGRSSDLAYIDQGRCVIRLRDTNGTYNPENAGNLVNLVTNPSVEVDTTGWSITAPNTIAQSSDQAQYGTSSLKSTYNAGGGLGLGDYEITLTAVQHTVSAWVYVPSDWDAAALLIVSAILFTDATGTTSAYPDMSKRDQWQRVSFTFTPAAGDLAGYIHFAFYNAYPTAGRFIYIDGLQVEESAAVTSYTDGDQDNCRWSGTAHASTSYRGGPLYSKLDVMRPLRVTATYAGATYGLFYGFISEIGHNPGRYERESIIVAVDFMEWLTRSKTSIVIAEVTNERVDQLIGRILDAIEWTEPSMRSFDVSSTTVPAWSADGTKSPLELIEDLLAIDRGVFFVDGRGRTCYRSRDIHYQSGTPVDTFTSAQISRLRSSISAVDIVNSITVTRTGGAAQTATDATSRTRYGYRDGAAITSAYLATDNQAEDLAQFLVRLQKNPRIPARELSLINGDATRLTSQLAREIGDLVTVDEAEGGTNFVGRVQAIEHDISEAFTVHRTRFMVPKVELVPFIVGESAIGSTHVVVY